MKIFNHKSNLCAHKKSCSNKHIIKEKKNIINHDDNICNYNNDQDNKFDNLLIENLLLKQKLNIVIY